MFHIVINRFRNLSIKRFMLLANHGSFGLDIFVRYPQHGGGKNVLTMTEE